MPKKFKYTLTPEQEEILEKAIKHHSDPKVVHRATGIRSLHLGHKPKEVAQLLAVSLATVYNWHTAWRANGLAGLADLARSGRPHVATEAYCEALDQAISQDPQELGYAFVIWTVERLMAHLAEKTNITMSHETFRQLLQRRHYVYRSPKHDLTPLQDAQAHERAEQLIDELKKKPREAKSNFSLWTKQP